MNLHNFISLNAVSKYIIAFMFAIIVVLSGLLAIWQADNHRLRELVAEQKATIELQQTTIKKCMTNIENIKEQFLSLEKSCALRLKAKDDANLLVKWVPPENPQPTNAKDKNKSKGRVDEVISKAKSDFAVNCINSYWGGLLQQ